MRSANRKVKRAFTTDPGRSGAAKIITASMTFVTVVRLETLIVILENDGKLML